MKAANPVYTQAISAATFVALIKAILAVLIAFRVFTFDDKQSSTVDVLIDTAIPILAIFFGAWWASRKVTPLSSPRDIDGVPLTRPDNSPAIIELENVHQEAIKINQSVDKEIDERRLRP